jgi:hypothetical protein
VLSSIVKLTRLLLEVLGKGGNLAIEMLLHRNRGRKSEEKSTVQLTLKQIVLTIGSCSSFNSKKQMGIAMCLEGIPRMHHWQSGVTAFDQHTRKSKTEENQMSIFRKT